MLEFSRLGEQVFQGIAAAAGIARGKALVIERNERQVPRYDVSEPDLPRELERFESALTATRRQIHETKRQVSEAMGADAAGIFDAHLLVLEDQSLIGEVLRLAESQRINIDFILEQVADKYVRTLSSLQDDYLRERAKDVRDVINRVLDNLLSRRHGAELAALREPCIIIAEDLAPSLTAQLRRDLVLGFATDIGSKTSHTAILARSLRLPAVVGLQTASRLMRTGQSVLLDGYNGLLILNPTDQALYEYGQVERRQFRFEERLNEVHDQPAITLDGHRITLSANLEQVAGIEAVQSSGAEGVGLFRTEFLFIKRHTTPTEQEQYEAYRQVAAALKPQPVVIRTLDLGGDKFVSHLEMPSELNPFLGWRAIRFCLQEEALFRSQLRAILRASAEGNVKMMYPMVCSVEELDAANALLDRCRAELRAEAVPFDESMDVGVMIEVPSAVMIADSLARRVKFFSLGTNDLIQYTLAVDRTNEKIAHLYSPTHPAIVRLIQLAVEAAHQHGIWVGVCGEMAGDPVLAPLLLGLGIDELSVAPPLVPRIKFLIRRLKLAEAQELADLALTSDSAGPTLERCQALARHAAPSLFDNAAGPADSDPPAMEPRSSPSAPADL